MLGAFLTNSHKILNPIFVSFVCCSIIMTNQRDVTSSLSMRPSQPALALTRERLWHLLATLWILIQYSHALLQLAWTCVSFRVIFWWNPERKRRMVEHMNEAAHMNITTLDVTDWQDTLFTWSFFKQDAKTLLLDFYQKVHLHGPAENVDVIQLDGTPAKLLDFSSSEERPLVVNFGSCT